MHRRSCTRIILFLTVFAMLFSVCAYAEGGSGFTFSGNIGWTLSTGDVAKNITTGRTYATVEQAVAAASSGNTIVVLKNTTVSSSITVPNGVTLFVPYADASNSSGYADGTLECSKVFSAPEKAYCTLTLASNVTMTVNGTLRIGGVISRPSTDYQGHTSGAFGKLVNNGTITVSDGGVLDCFGFIEGSGTVKGVNGAVLYEPFVVYDFVGGKNTVKLENAGTSPFSQYTMQNITCAMELQAGATLYGRCNLHAQGEYHKTDAVIVGGPYVRGLITLKDGAVLRRTVDKSRVIKDYCTDIGSVSYDITGGAIFNYLSMEIMEKNVTTKGTLLPIPYGYRYQLDKGEYDLSTDIVIMPGAEVVVGSEATLEVHEPLMVLDGLLQNVLSRMRYPTTEVLKASGFNTNGALIVNGKLELDAGVPFGGIVQANRLGAQVTTAKQSGSDDSYANTVTLGAEAEYGNNKTVLPLEGRLMLDGTLTKLVSGKTYTATHLNTWTLSGYSVTSYTEGENIESIVTKGAVTVSTAQSMKGSFSVSVPDVIKGDISGDGSVNATDLLRMKKFLAGITQDVNELNGDVNGDGSVNALDLLRLKKYLAHIITTL